MEVGIWLSSLGLDGSTALAARLDPEDPRVGVGDPIGASAAQESGVVDGVPGKPAAPEATTSG